MVAADHCSRKATTGSTRSALRTGPNMARAATGSALSLPKVALAREPYPEIRKMAPSQVTATACRMSWFADWLLHQGEMGDRVVVDQTGLGGITTSC